MNESIGAVDSPHPPAHGIQDVGGTVTTASNFDAHPNMVAVKQSEHGLDATVVASSRGGDKPEKNTHSIIVSITVNDAFCTVASVLRRSA